MSFLKKLFGGGASSDTTQSESETYKGYRITPTPQREGTHFRIGAHIEKEVDGALRSHTLIRADTIGDLETAKEASVGKARQIIDEQGDRLFR